MNSDQHQIYQDLKQFLASTSKFFLLTGAAGTGKTTLITYFISQELKNKKVAVTGCTNKAVGVLEEMYQKNPFLQLKNKKDEPKTSLFKEISFLTIHKLLKIKRKIDSNGKEIFYSTIDEDNRQIKAKSIFHYDFIIVDEVSMLGEDLTLDILRLKDKIKGKIVFVGDKAQLPPVNEEISHIFKLKSNIPSGELTQVMRSGKTIIRLATKIRQLVSGDRKKIGLTKLENPPIITLYRKHNKTHNGEKLWLDQYFKLLDQDQQNIILTYTNNRTDALNRIIRRHIYPGKKLDNNTFLPGERIIFTNFYYHPNNKKKYYSSEVAKISDLIDDSSVIRGFNLYDLQNIQLEISEIDSVAPLVAKRKNYPKPNVNPILVETPGFKLDKNICPICLVSNLDQNETHIRKTECGHQFCDQCIKTWLSKSKTCPLCRTKLEGKTTTKYVFKDDPVLTSLINNLKDRTNNVKYKTWLITLDSDDQLVVIHPDDRPKYQADLEYIYDALKQIRTHIDQQYSSVDQNYFQVILQRLWDFYYYHFIDGFAQINYGYAITTHRSQGSTYQNVFLDMSDIISRNRTEKQGFQCLYTAVTRASKSVNILY